jgi:hypothetical protein
VYIWVSLSLFPLECGGLAWQPTVNALKAALYTSALAANRSRKKNLMFRQTRQIWSMQRGDKCNTDTDDTNSPSNCSACAYLRNLFLVNSSSQHEDLRAFEHWRRQLGANGTEFGLPLSAQEYETYFVVRKICNVLVISTCNNHFVSAGCSQRGFHLKLCITIFVNLRLSLVSN